MKLEITSFSIAHGQENEDCVANIAINGDHILVIADGVGSSEFSREASKIAVETSLKTLNKEGVNGMPAAFEDARKALTVRAQEVGAKSMSTTLTICWVSANSVVFGHVGDARIYHLRNGGLQTRTTDQTEIEHLVAQGVLSRERAKKYPRRNVLLSAVSSSSQFELQLGQFAIEVGDRILLLTDGLHKQISKHEIVEMSVRSSSVNAFLDLLRTAIQGKGLVDDASAIGAEIIA